MFRFGLRSTVDWYASKRMNVLIDKVLSEIGIVDYILRSEYQSRKAVHWHMAARTLGVRMEDIQTACKKYNFDVRLSTEDEAQLDEQELRDYTMGLKKQGINIEDPISEELRERVTECRDRVIEFSTKVLGLSSCHPQPDPKLWPGPEGQDVSAPPTNCLRENVLELTDLEEDYVRLINRVMLQCVGM